MKVLHVTPAFPPSTGYGGGPSVAYQMCRGLVQRGHSVVVYTTDAGDGRSRLTAGCRMVDGIEVHYFRNISNQMAYRFKFFATPKMVGAMQSLLSDVDVIHAHDFRTSQVVITHYLVRSRHPYVLQAHGAIPRNGRFGRPKAVFDWAFGHRILRHAERLIALNAQEADAYVEMGSARSKVEIVPNGISLSDYARLPARGRLRQRYGLQDAKILLFMGRVHQSKGLDFLVRSFSELVRRLPEARLMVAGPDDGYLTQMRQLVGSMGLETSVLFTGFMAGQDKLAAYVDADVFVTPRYTGFPLTFLEAMACGQPVVTTDVGDQIEGIDGIAGCVTGYDEQEYGAVLAELLQSSELRARLSKGARQVARQHDWATIVDRLEEIYQEVQDR